jgi:general secretion pathway protein D
MDGNHSSSLQRLLPRNWTRKSTEASRRMVRLGIAIALLCGGQLGADLPPSTLVRPPARLITVDQAPPISSTSGSDQTAPVAGVTLVPLAAADQSSIAGQVSVEEALETPGSVTFRKTPLSEVVFMLSDLWHINIVASESISGEVSGSFQGTPLREVLGATLAATGYSYRQTGNSLIVLPVDQVGADDPSFTTEMIRLPPALLADDSVLAAANLMLSDRGRLQQIGTDAVLVVDSDVRVTRIRRLFADMESTGEATAATTSPAPTAVVLPQNNVGAQFGIAYFSPQFTEAEEMAEPLQAALGEQTVVAVYSAENRIMVRGSSEDLQLAAQAIEQLDRPRSQVRITAMIYDVDVRELEEIGVNWTRDLRAIANSNNPPLAGVTSSVEEMLAFTADLTGTGVTRVGLETLTDRIGAGVFLQLLDANAEAKLLADPSITVDDRQEATIRIVRKIPIIGANPIEGSNAVFTQTEFEEAGVILTVRPRISGDGTIELRVEPEFSFVAPEENPNGPVIDSRNARTTVRIADGQMFVLGGLRQKESIESVRGIPYLKDMKFVGKLFRSHSTSVRESELIVFLRPEVITPYSCGTPRGQVAASVTRQQLDAIPHAEMGPTIPCCRDPLCPNHHPRPRINGGSQSLGGQYPGLDQGIIYADVIEDGATIQDGLGSVTVEEVDPPLHIDTRRRGSIDAQ